MDDSYFKEYAFRISVVISGPNLDFSNVETQDQIETIISALETSKYIDENLTYSWLRDFLDYIKRNKGYADLDLPVETEKDFANTLKEVYLADPNNMAKLDVAFNENDMKIDAARFLIQVSQIFISYFTKTNEL